MFGFVTEEVHSEYGTDASANQGYKKQRSLRYTVRMPDGFTLINTHDEKTDYVNYNQINGKVISVIEDGNNTYQFVKSNYFLFIDILLGIWVLSSTLTNENEMRKHNIAKV